MNWKNKKVVVWSIALLLIVVAAFLLLTRQEADFVTYTTFVSDLENGEIKCVTIAGEEIIYQKIEDTRKYSTVNPDYDTFKQELLLKGIVVKEAVNAGDIVFDILCLGMIGFCIYKLAFSFSYQFKVVRHTNVHFSDIAGMEDIKKDALCAVDILKNPKKYKRDGIRAVKGIVLEGPPGNGKTFFAKALAQEADINFIAAKGADFQSMMMSIGSARIKSLFRKARKHKPCIIFIDEFDGIGEKRSYAGSGIDKENNRMIISMLNEMDGFDSSAGVLVIAATNSYKSLDAALIRPGRFDRKYHIGNPDTLTRKKLIEIYMGNKQVSLAMDREELAEEFAGFSCSAIETILNEASMIALNSGSMVINMDCIREARERTRL